MKRYRVLMLAVLCAAVVTAASAAAGEEITAEQAKEIALQQTGGGTIMDLGRHERGRRGEYYRLEIAAEDGDYHVEVDARTGRLLQLVRKHGRRGMTASSPSRSADVQATPQTGTLAFDRIHAIAMERAGGGIMVESELDSRRGRGLVYEVEVMNATTEYEMDIDAHNGDIVEFKQKHDRGRSWSSADTRMNAVQAVAAGLDRVGGGTMVHYELERDDGRWFHEMEYVNDNRKYEVVIEDDTGAVVDFKEKRR